MAICGNTARNQASNARSNELISCLNQWNDYRPSLVRFIERRQEDQRNKVDLRLDFKVNQQLSIFAKGSYARRRVDHTTMTLALDSLNLNPDSTVSPTYQGTAYIANASGVRSAVPGSGSGYYLYDNANYRAQVATARGAVANVDPGSVSVDANHHVTQFTISDANANTDQIHNVMQTSDRYFQTGGTLSGTNTMSPQQFQDIIAASMTQKNTPFFHGAPDRPDGLIDGWTQIDVEKVFALSGIPNVNVDCVKQCAANDGSVYQQPVTRYRERTTAGYVMTDFSLDQLPFTNRGLPFGMTFDGNFGYRIVRTKIQASGTMGLTSILTTANYDAAAPNAVGGTVTATTRRATTMQATTTDYLPILNLALWLVPDQVVLRYNRAKQVARPPVTALIPSGDCTYDQRNANPATGDDGSQICSGTIGNPQLRAQTNLNQNLGLEWYPNPDTWFSLRAATTRSTIIRTPPVAAPIRWPTTRALPISRMPRAMSMPKFLTASAKNLDIFAEGRNLGLRATSNSQGRYAPFADGTPNLLDVTYAGRRIMLGMNYRN